MALERGDDSQSDGRHRYKLKQSCVGCGDEAQQPVQPTDSQPAEHCTHDECTCPNDDILHC